MKKISFLSFICFLFGLLALAVLAYAAPSIITPVPGSTLMSSTVTFTGGHTSADLQHWLYFGTTQGASDLFSQDLGMGHTVTVGGLPHSGTIWVRYWTRFSAGWAFTDQSYTRP